MASTNPYLITGIQAGKDGNKVPVRREIDEWWFSDVQNDVNQRSLFVHALKEFMSLATEGNPSDEQQDLSFFGVAGIHGSPIRRWPTVSGPEEGANGSTYCAHGLKTFGTWHTPYMLLYEQRIYQVMTSLIEKKYDASVRSDMKRAADTWRLPFWDWAKKKPTWNARDPRSQDNKLPGVGPNIPFIVTQQEVEVLNFKGTPEKTSNPLFKPALKRGESFYQFRVGRSAVWVEPRKDHGLITNGMQGSVVESGGMVGQGRNQRWQSFANSLPDVVYRLLRNNGSEEEPAMPYEAFVTQGWQAKENSVYYPSLEDVHGKIHVICGGSMGNTDAAAFDPIFWLHHCNIDRLLAIWQVLYPKAYKKWLDSGSPGEADGPNTELKPFRGADGKFFTSKTCSTRFQEFGYTYPELQEWKHADRNTYLKNIIARVDRLYSTTSKAALLLDQNEEVSTIQMSAMTPANLATEFFPSALVQQAKIEPIPVTATAVKDFGKPEEHSWSNIDYVVDVVYERFALRGEPYTVYIFLGDVPEGTGQFDFRTDASAISLVHNFVSPSELLGSEEDGCANCRKQEADRQLSSGQCILTDYLIERIASQKEDRGLTLKSLERSEVVPYLRKNLHWRVTDGKGNLVPKEDERLSLLKVSVATADATHYSDPTKFSQYGQYEWLYEITEGRLAGAADGDL